MFITEKLLTTGQVPLLGNNGERHGANWTGPVSLSTLTVSREEAGGGGGGGDGGGGGGGVKKKDVTPVSWLNDWAARQSMLRPDVTL